MVWALSYRPKPARYPPVELIEGTRELVLEDNSLDGGGNLLLSAGDSGRRVKPDCIPKVIQWKSTRKLLDLESAFCRSVSSRFRELIENIEPGSHQFEPIQFIKKDGSPLQERWFWQVCNRLEGASKDHTNFDTSSALWRPALIETPRLAFDLQMIGDAKFWHEKHLIGGPYVIDQVKAQIEDAGMTGVFFGDRLATTNQGLGA